MRKLFILLALAVGLLVAVDAQACGKHGGRRGGASGAAAGGCGASGGSATVGGCAWVPVGDSGYAYVDRATGRQLGYYASATGVYTPYLGQDRWGEAVVLGEPATRSGTLAAK